MKRFSGYSNLAALKNANAPPDVFLLDDQDLLFRLHLTKSTLKRWRKKGMLPHYKMGRKIYYKESELTELLKKYKRE